MTTTICERCGQAIAEGSWPFCPHERGAAHVIDDALPGGARYVHNLGDTPVWVETKTQFRQELASRGLEQVERKTYNRDDKSPWATRTHLRPGQRDPFLHRATR